MMEQLPYQCSVVADAWAEVYVISKQDLLRNTPRSILHKLFCDYKARLTDDRLMQRLKQSSRWNNYKTGLLEDIRKRRTNGSSIDRRGPLPRRAGVGELRQEDYNRLGNDEKLWDKRAQTPPKQAYTLSNSSQDNSIRASFRIHNLELRVLEAVPATLARVKAAIREAVASEAGHGTRPHQINLELSEGSLVASLFVASAARPKVLAALASSATLASALAAKVADVEGVGPVRVEGPEFPEVDSGGGALAAGTRVQLAGLRRHQHMNGISGTLVEQKDDSKWLVKLDSEQGEKIFKAKHLEEMVDEVQWIFKVQCTRDERGVRHVEVDYEPRDASAAALDDRTRYQRRRPRRGDASAASPSQVAAEDGEAAPSSPQPGAAPAEREHARSPQADGGTRSSAPTPSPRRREASQRAPPQVASARAGTCTEPAAPSQGPRARAPSQGGTRTSPGRGGGKAGDGAAQHRLLAPRATAASLKEAKRQGKTLLSARLPPVGEKGAGSGRQGPANAPPLVPRASLWGPAPPAGAPPAGALTAR
mmetsp:Transcript_74596/g.231579  ORF Transcript_74596/g.231579 Transcript_74596/m.231579 type:complete len:536 (+) Transcript_74596:2-1609(+)